MQSPAGTAAVDDGTGNGGGSTVGVLAAWQTMWGRGGEGGRLWDLRVRVGVSKVGCGYYYNYCHGRLPCAWVGPLPPLRPSTKPRACCFYWFLSIWG